MCNFNSPLCFGCMNMYLVMIVGQTFLPYFSAFTCIFKTHIASCISLSYIYILNFYQYFYWVINNRVPLSAWSIWDPLSFSSSHQWDRTVLCKFPIYMNCSICTALYRCLRYLLLYLFDEEIYPSAGVCVKLFNRKWEHTYRV
jgi:hypothetical protein